MHETAAVLAKTISSALQFAGGGKKEIQVKTTHYHQQDSGLMTDLLTGRARVP